MFLKEFDIGGFGVIGYNDVRGLSADFIIHVVSVLLQPQVIDYSKMGI